MSKKRGWRGFRAVTVTGYTKLKINPAVRRYLRMLREEE